MNSGWLGVEGEIARLLYGTQGEGDAGWFDLSNWRADADWVRLCGDRRLRTGDQEAIESCSVLRLSAVLSALWSFGTPVVLVARWSGSELIFGLGRGRSPEHGAGVLAGLFPPDTHADLVVPWIDPLDELPGLRHGLVLTGRPGRGASGLEATPIESLAMAAGQDQALLLAILWPVGRIATTAAVRRIQDGLRASVHDGHTRPTDLLTQGLLRLAEEEITYRLQGVARGLWNLRTCLLAETPEALHRASAAVAGALAGERAIGPVLGWQPLDPGSRDPGPELGEWTWIDSGGAAAIMALPRRPLPGFAIEARSEFDLPRSGPAADVAVVLGRIEARGRPSGCELRLPVSDFQRHLLVCGVTGSGKSLTTAHLLLALHREHGIPWLVIEPIKGDYWRLGLDVTEAPGRGVPALRVLTPGDATPGSSNPLSLNPFVFPESIPLTSHLDLLKSVFFAAFALYPPMPYVLETALHQTYERAGWDLVTSRWGRGRRPDRFPSLSDFIDVVDDLTARLGYEGEVKASVRTGLLVRLNNLRAGGKGLLLDGPTSWTIDRLLDRPTVVELGAFGSDEEKALVSGLIFALLYEHREAEARRGTIAPGLRHVLVIEEAHRLLRRTALEQGVEGGNVRGQAVERIAGMLSEIRSYGQGVVIVDQSPEKLAPDAMRNTSTKIIHRIVAADDRQAVARAANLSPAQERELAVLPPGQAVVAAEGIREPVLVHIPETRLPAADSRGRIGLLRRDAARTEALGGNAAPFGPRCVGCSAVGDARCGAVRASVRHFLLGGRGAVLVAAFWLRAADPRRHSVSKPDAREVLDDLLGGTPVEHDAAARRCAAAQLAGHVVRLCASDASGRERSDGWMADLERALADGSRMDARVLARFQTGRAPLPGCGDWCAYRCLFGPAVDRLLDPSPSLLDLAQEEVDEPGDHPERCVPMLAARLAAQAGFPGGRVPNPVLVCAVIHLARELEGSSGRRGGFLRRTLVAYASSQPA